jgi:hypothetical protein
MVAVATWAAIGAVGPVQAAVSGGTWGPGEPVAGVAALVPAGQPANGFINAVSCYSPGNCAAVGIYTYTGKNSSGVTANFQMPLVVTEANGTWGDAQAVTGAAGLGNGTSAELTLVSCGAAGDCTAAGHFEGTDGRQHAFLVSEASDSWGTATKADDSGLGTSQMTRLLGLSCSAAGDCTAVGGSENESTDVVVPVTVDEAGHAWGPVQALAGLSSASDSGYLATVSCTAPGQCAAGGSFPVSSPSQPFVVSESGGSAASPGTWGAPQAVPGFSLLSNSADAIVTSVSCGDATHCAVTGLFGASASYGQVFTADESGGTWGQASQLSIPGTTLPVNYFTPQVSCSPSHTVNCAITGISRPAGSTDGTEQFVASESASGAWDAAQAVPGIPAGDDNIPYAVSCDPSGSCTVAGNYEAIAGRVAEDYTAVISAGGTVGNEQPLAAPAGNGDFGTAFLDCPQQGYCTLADSSLAGGSPDVVTEGTASAVTLTAPASMTYGSEQGDVLTASVTSPAGGTPSGTVTVTEGTTPVCTITLAGGQGTCSLSAKAIPAGGDTLTATYSGDATYVPATSTAIVTVAAPPALSYYTPLTPVRLLDTRNGTGAPKAPVGPGKTIALQVTAPGGVPIGGITAVVLNVTATGPTAGGFVTAYPDGQPRPAEGSNLNFSKGETIANLVTVAVGSDGEVDLYNNAGSVNLVADLQGYYTANGGSGLVTAGPTRLLDTRNGTGGFSKPVAAGKDIALQVTGLDGVPGTGVTAIVLNVTATGPTEGGYVTAYPDGQPRPAQGSNLNFTKGETIPNLVIAQVGSDGKVDLYNGSGGTVNLVADLQGYYTANGGSGLVTAGPARVLDTRNGTGGFSTPVASGQDIALQVTGLDGVPATGVTAVVLNLTATDPAEGGYVTAYPDGQPRPAQGSNVNFTKGETIPNLVIAQVGSDGKIDLYNGSGGTVNLVGDLFGYFTS